MITATATGANGEQIIVLGVTRGNIDRLTTGQAIRVDAEHHPGFPPGLKVMIFFEESERELVAKLKPLLGEETQIVAVPRHAGPVS